MIYLERLRDDPLLLDALESNIAEWVNGMEDLAPDMDGVSRNLLIGKDIELPEEVRRYWAMAKRWRDVPILGKADGSRFESKPRFVSWGEKPMITESKKTTEYLTKPGKHFLMMVSGSIANCKCCGWGLSRAAESSEWLLTDIDDRKLRKTETFDANIFLLDWALRHFTHTWYNEENSGEFQPLIDKREVIWNQGDHEFWFNPVGVFGWTYGSFRGDRIHRIAVQSREKISEIVGHELTPPLW